jgi:hypothetical protein
VVALADVFRRFADDYLARHGASVLPSGRRSRRYRERLFRNIAVLGAAPLPVL